ncbi:MAG TPA: hypothetical protein VL574_11405 [Stellaceae bacterium]|nr:hypothetical protein [Stellaceae bacterium]
MRRGPTLAILLSLALAGTASARTITHQSGTPETAAPQTAPAEPATSPTADAAELVRLFAHTCLIYPGRTAALRTMLDSHHIPALSDKAAALFLPGGKGKGYDTSTAGNRMALLSEDGDICTVLGERADSKAVVSLIESGLKSLHSNAHFVGEDNDPATSDLHHRHYDLTTKSGKPYELIVSTSAAPNHIQAIITIGPKPKG